MLKWMQFRAVGDRRCGCVNKKAAADRPRSLERRVFMNCEKCGAVLEDDAKLCPQCGTAVGPEPQTVDDEATTTLPEDAAVTEAVEETAEETVAPAEDEAPADEEAAEKPVSPAEDEAPADEEAAEETAAPAEDEVPADEETAEETVALTENEASADEETVALAEDEVLAYDADSEAVPANTGNGARFAVLAAVIVVLIAAIGLLTWKVLIPRLEQKKAGSSTSQREPAKYPQLAEIAKSVSAESYSVQDILVPFSADASQDDVTVPALATENAPDVTVDSAVTAENAKDPAAFKLAQSILQQYLDGDHTEEAFGALAKKFSKDADSADNGGLYTDVARGDKAAPVDDWCVYENRVADDVGIVEADDGYHVLRFVKSSFSAQALIEALTQADPKTVEVSDAEYQFYYMNTYYIIQQNISYYGYYYGIEYDYTAMPDTQPYNGQSMFGEIEAPDGKEATWADAIDYMVRENLRMVKAGCALAEKVGITLDDASIAQIDSQIEQVGSVAKSNGETADAYLQEGYGKAVTIDAFRSILEDQQLYLTVVSETQAALADGYSDDEVNAAYEADPLAYGVLSYRIYSLPAGERDWVLRLSGAQSEEEFLQLAAEADAALRGDAEDADILNDDSQTLQKDVPVQDLYDNDFLTWVKNENAVPGAVAVTGNASDGYKVYYITEGLHHPADDLYYSVRHILIPFSEDISEPDTSEDAAPADDAEPTDETEPTAEADAPTDAESETAAALDLSKAGDVTVDITADTETLTDAKAYQTTQSILQKYLDGEHTAEAFGVLAQQFSEDPGSADNGGLYENVPVGQMVQPFEDWSLADGRKQGDVGIVETSYGYHVMYFEGLSVTTWMDTIRTALAEADAAKFSVALQTAGNDAVPLPDEMRSKAIEACLTLIRSQLETPVEADQ